jgi:hypothetical protein
MATPDHTPAGRGFESAAIYWNGMNDWWTSVAETCPPGKLTNRSVQMVDLFVSGGNDSQQFPAGHPAWASTYSFSASARSQALTSSASTFSPAGPEQLADLQSS